LVGRPAGRLADKRGHLTVTAAGVICASAILVALAFAPSAAVLALLWAAMGGAAVTIGSPLNAKTVTASDVNRAGVISVVGAVRFSGQALAPLIWIPIYHEHHRLSFLLAAVSVFGVILTFRNAKGARRDKPAEAIAASV
jgi:MFS family permease